jgi:Tfp pilus assembly protein PilF
VMVRAETRLARGDTAGGRTALAEVIAAAPTLVGPHLQLASLDEAAGEYDAAIARYRRVLALQPTNAAVLNNLAYNLAVRKNAPAEAKPLAERAVTLSKRNATIVDTLGWIEHLLGNNATAAALLDEAIKGAAGSAEIRLHAAFVAADLRLRAKADGHLKEALRRNATLSEQPEVAALRARIDSLTP